MTVHAVAQTVPGLGMQRVIFVLISVEGAAAIAAAARSTPVVVARINFGGDKGGGNATPRHHCTLAKSAS